jgi:hypothetical protein
VVRLWRAGERGDEDVTLTKAFLTEEAAQKEADQMNELNGKRWSYSVDVVRLVEGPDEGGNSRSDSVTDA